MDVYPEMIFQPNELEHIKLNEPAGYRIVISGSTDSIEIFNGVEWVVARAPQTPCCYVLNSTSARHRIKEDIGRKMIYIRGFLNREKHLELLSKSYERYKDYAVNNLVGTN